MGEVQTFGPDCLSQSGGGLEFLQSHLKGILDPLGYVLGSFQHQGIGVSESEIETCISCEGEGAMRPRDVALATLPPALWAIASEFGTGVASQQLRLCWTSSCAHSPNRRPSELIPARRPRT